MPATCNYDSKQTSENQGTSQQICKKCKHPLPEGAKFCPQCGTNQTARPQKPKSRGNGQGSVYQLPNKTWVAAVTLGYELDKTGTPRRKVAKKKGFKTKREAAMYLPQLKQSQGRERNITFQQLFNVWEPTHRAGKSTMDCYRAAFKYFRPVWFQTMRWIDIDDLQECLDECDKGKRTKENMKALCGLLYKYAIPRHYVTLNLGPYLTVGRGESSDRTAIPMEDLKKLEQAIGKVPYADYVVAQCYLGFRPSELLALDVSKYNRKERTFTGGAKTDAGKDRVVPVSPKIQNIVDRLVHNRIAGPVFCAANGGPLDIKDYRDLFYAALQGAGVENPMEGTGDMRRHRYTPHSCRHTFATMLKNTAGSDKDKLSLIGHTSTEMLRHYQDVDVESLRAIVNNL